MDKAWTSVELLDGRTIGIRAIAPTDADALVRFHEKLSSETTRLRFFTMHPHLSPFEVERFTNVDHHDREGYVGLDGDDVIAVGRFDRMVGSGSAEVAFVVADDWQGQGVASRLLEVLATRAREEGIIRLVAETLGENHRMRGVFRRSGMRAVSETSAGVVHVSMELSAAEPATP